MTVRLGASGNVMARIHPRKMGRRGRRRLLQLSQGLVRSCTGR
jgi:hypothetical protein